MSSKSIGKPLTADLVFTKTKSDSLHNIKNLNLWGNDLQDLSLIQKMPNLEVISLSVNKISSLKDFAHCQKLQELYLRKNNISDLKQIRYLINLSHLKVLWLHDNPCAQVKNYREIVIKYLPNLIKLDNNPVTQQQKAACQHVSYNLQIPRNEGNFKSQKYHEEVQEKKINKPSNYQHFSQDPYYTQNQSVEPDVYREQNQYKEKAFKKAGIDQKKNIYQGARDEDINRNQNILMAILSLMRELDSSSLQIVKRQADRMQQQN